MVNIKVVKEVTITETITLSEDELIQVLKEHFNKPNAEVRIDCHREFLQEVRIVSTTTTTEE